MNKPISFVFVLLMAAQASAIGRFGGGGLMRGAAFHPNFAPAPHFERPAAIQPQRVEPVHMERPAIQPAQASAVRAHFQNAFAGHDYGSGAWAQAHPGAWHPPEPKPQPAPGPHPQPHPDPHPQPGPHPQPHPPGPGPHPVPPPPPPPPPPFNWWVAPVWSSACVFWGFDAAMSAIPYDYGSTVTYSGDTVYVNGVPYVKADAYYKQADALAGSDEKLDTDGWLAMGTFSVVASGDQKESAQVLQLATDTKGHIRGNLINQKDDTVTPVYGNVDAKTQRVAFKLEGHPGVVAECGLWNLTQDSLTMLVHLSKDKAEKLSLVRVAKK